MAKVVAKLAEIIAACIAAIDLDGLFADTGSHVGPTDSNPGGELWQYLGGPWAEAKGIEETPERIKSFRRVFMRNLGKALTAQGYNIGKLANVNSTFESLGLTYALDDENKASIEQAFANATIASIESAGVAAVAAPLAKKVKAVAKPASEKSAKAGK